MGDSLEVLQGKSINLQLKEFSFPVFFLIENRHIKVMPEFEDEADANLSVSIPLLISMTASSKEGSVLGSDMEMSGDIEVGRQFRDVFRNLDIDWEEILSQYTGDVLAFQIHQKGSQLAEFFKQGLQSLAQTSSEYLREEARMTPTAPEFDHFQRQVSSLRQDVDRTEARLRELLSRVNSKSGS